MAERQVASGAIDLRTAGDEAVALVCKGLCMLCELVDGGLYSAEQIGSLRAFATRLCPHLVEGILKKDMAISAEGAAATLALLTWFCNGVQSGLLSADDDVVRAVFAATPQPLLAQAGLIPPGGQPAALTSAPALLAHGGPPLSTAATSMPTHTTSTNGSQGPQGPQRMALAPQEMDFAALVDAAGKGDDGAFALALSALDGATLRMFCAHAGGKALVGAAEAGHGDIVARLLAAGVDTHAQPDAAARALLCAVRHGHGKVLDALLRAGGAALARQELEANRTALVLAVQCGQVGILERLLRFDQTLVAQILSDGSTALLRSASLASEHREALQDVNVDIWKLLRQAGENLSLLDRSTPPSSGAKATRRQAAAGGRQGSRQGGPNMLLEALGNRDVVAMRKLLRTPAGKAWAREKVQDGCNKLMVEALRGDARMMEALLEVDDGALARELSVRGSSALMMAAGAGNLDVLKLLLKFDKGSLAWQTGTLGGMNALMMAAVNGQLACVKVLLAWKGGALAARDALTNTGENALILAAAKGHAEVVRVLLAHQDGALATLSTPTGYTALSHAAERGWTDVVRLLLGWRQRQLALQTTSSAYTPLLLAAREGHADVLACLLPSWNGAALAQARLPDGRNALMLAAEGGHDQAIDTLLAAGMDPCLQTDAGATASALAARGGHGRAADVLLRAEGAALLRRQLRAGRPALLATSQNQAGANHAGANHAGANPAPSARMDDGGTNAPAAMPAIPAIPAIPAMPATPQSTGHAATAAPAGETLRSAGASGVPSAGQAKDMALPAVSRRD